ncbi:MAG: hypothetical protein EOP33_06665 [Rickettsiaceae bacterium]|nr:MAG: hypothetical protein EOP33_06665 [Rickettsiaceae bacterium]
MHIYIDQGKLMLNQLTSYTENENSQITNDNQKNLDSLFGAVIDNEIEQVKYIITLNPKLAFKKNINGHTPLHVAAFCGHEEIVKILVHSNPILACIKVNNGHTPLHFAAAEGHQGVARILLATEANPNATSDNGETPLHRAAFKAHQGVVRNLLFKGANPNIINEEKTVLDIAANTIQDLEMMELLKDASAIYKIIASPALDQQEVKIEGKAEIKNLDLLSSILNHNFQLHNKTYKSKAELKHIFNHIKPNNAQQQVKLDQIKMQFDKIIEDSIDYVDQNKIPDLQYLAAVSPLVKTLQIISDKEKNDDQKAAAFVEVFYSQAFNIPEDYRSYVTQIFKLNAKMIQKIAQTHPKVAKDLFNVVTCTNEQRDQYKAKIEDSGCDIKEGINITSTENLKNESDITNNDDIFSLFPQSTIAELFSSNPLPKSSLEGHIAVDIEDNQVSIAGQIALPMTDSPMEDVG